jgi:glucose uptake protein GlcU
MEKLLAQSDSIISRPVGQGILPGGGAEGSDIQSSILFAKIIPFLITWTINLAIGLTVVMIIVSGYLFLTSYGDDEKKQKATRTLTYSLIGLILALTAYGIVAILTSIQLS